SHVPTDRLVPPSTLAPYPTLCRSLLDDLPGPVEHLGEFAEPGGVAVVGVGALVVPGAELTGPDGGEALVDGVVLEIGRGVVDEDDIGGIVGHLLPGHLRPAAVVARVGSDEFESVLAEHLGDPR